MSRVKIDLPAVSNFSTIIPIRITDINYGGHVGNDTVLSIIHESRVQFLQHYGFSEMNIEGVGLIMRDVVIDFRKELFYNEKAIIHVTASEFSKVSFELYYKLEKESTNQNVIVAIAKTGMVCYDYQKKRISSLPEAFRQKLEAAGG